MPPPRVLIVEDDPDVREFMDILLSSAGYETDTAGYGGEAPASMRARLPDIVLLDLQMPVVDGFQFRAQQLSDTALSRVPVVCVTAAFNPTKAATYLARTSPGESPPTRSARH